MTAAFDVAVVGAGPAGCMAALAAARTGGRTALLERGPYPGAKNVYGGVVYGRILDRVLPEWTEEAPIQRWITRRSTMAVSPQGSVSLDVRGNAWAKPPFNGATALRSEFDAWLADRAVRAGATLIPSTTATGLIYKNGRVAGVRTDRTDGDVAAEVVIACDGVNSFLAREAGLFEEFTAANLTLGVKEVLGFDRQEIDRRFGLRGREGVDIEILGCTSGIPGGGFIYTNLDSIAVGVVLSLEGLKNTSLRPEQVLLNMKEHPSIAPLIMGGELLEYSAHMIPEGGLDAMPELAADGLLVAGDAAGMCLAAGLYLEGVNFAMAAGMAAGETAAKAAASGRVEREHLREYTRALGENFVLKDHRRFRKIPHLLMSDRMQDSYPGWAIDSAVEMFTVRNPEPKPGLRKILNGTRKKHGLSWRRIARDASTFIRGFG